MRFIVSPLFEVDRVAITTKLSDGSHEARRLEQRRDAAVSCIASLAALITTILSSPLSECLKLLQVQVVESGVWSAVLAKVNGLVLRTIHNGSEMDRRLVLMALGTKH